MKSQFNEGDKVMILHGDKCGEFALVCSSDGEFTAVNVNGKTATYHNNNLKHEDDCVFTDDGLGAYESRNDVKKIDLVIKPNTTMYADYIKYCQENDVENLTITLISLCIGIETSLRMS